MCMLKKALVAVGLVSAFLAGCPQPSTPSTYMVRGNAGHVEGATISLMTLSGETLGTVGSDGEGDFSITLRSDQVKAGFLLRAVGGARDGIALKGALTATHRHDEQTQSYNVTAYTTLVDALSSTIDGNNAFNRQEQALGLLGEIGLLRTDEWASSVPSTVNEDAMLARVRSSGSIQAWAEDIVSDLADTDLTPENMDVFPMAHGGVLRAEASARLIRGATWHFAVQVALASGSTEDLQYRLTNAPTGMTVSSDGIITYAVPDNAPVGTRQFNLEVTNLARGKGRIVRQTLKIMAGTVVAEGLVGPEGGTVSDSWDEVVLEVPASTVSSEVTFRVIRATDETGNSIFTTFTDPPNAALSDTPVLRLPDELSLVEDFDQKGAGTRLYTRRGHVLSLSLNSYLPPLLFQRLPRGATIPFGFQAESREVSELVSYCGAPGADGRLCEGRDPVLLVHGFNLAPVGIGFGGGEASWGRFFDRLNSEGGFSVFEFRYYSGARFQDIAADLAEAISYLARHTGRKVHLVAHSFGGLVCRTYLQGLAAAAPSPLQPDTDMAVSYANDVASLCTLGTPHSGIFGNCQTFHETQFPKGRHGDAGILINLSPQLSVYQAGEQVHFNAIPGLNLREVYRVSSEEGEIVAALANLQENALPAVPVQVLIGLLRKGQQIANGDGLISYQGQRFHPSFSQACVDRPLPASSLSSIAGAPLYAEIRERLLGLDSRMLPGDVAPPQAAFTGYRHSDAIWTSGDTEARLIEDCAEGEPCWEPYAQVVEWLERCGTQSIAPDEFAIHMKILDAYDSSPVGNATVSLYRDGRVVEGTWEPGESGEATLLVPYLGPGRYSLRIQAPGYHPLNAVQGAQLMSLPVGAVEFGTMYLQEDTAGRGLLSGFVTNSSSIQPIAGVEIVVANGIRLLETSTNAAGYYIVDDLARGMWFVRATKTGYEPVQTSFNILPDMANDGPISLRPLSTGTARRPTVNVYDPDEHGWIANVAGKLIGWVSDSGSAPITETRLEWGKSSNGSDWQTVSFFDGALSFKTYLNGLSYGTTYYVRASAANQAFPVEVSHSSTYSFRTSSTVNRPELIADASDPSTTQGFVEGQNYYVTLRYMNIGDADAAATTGSFYLSTDDDGNYTDDYLVSGPFTVAPLSSGGWTNLRVDFTMPDLGTGEYKIKLVTLVDQYDEVDEISDAVYWRTINWFSAFDAPSKDHRPVCLPTYYPVVGTADMTAPLPEELAK